MREARFAASGLTRREVLGAGALAASFAFVPTRARAKQDLDAYVRSEMEAGRLPGVALTVVRADGSAWFRTYGLANISHDRGVQRDTPFMLASVSKTIVSVAVMQAVEDGLLDLEADVQDVAGFPVRNPEFPDDPITLRMLLTHTSTISDAWDTLIPLYVQGDSPIALGDFLRDYFTPGRRFYDAEANFLSSHPGNRYRYCNVGVALAAYLVEAASRYTFDTWCERRIFTPLEMSDTAWRLRRLPLRQVAMPYGWSNRLDRYTAYGQYGYPDYPDGQLRSSVVSLARFLTMFMRGGELDGVRVLEEATIEEMRSVQVQEEVHGQGLVWYVLHRHGYRYWGHDGGDSGVATQMYFDPTRGVSVITLANGDWRWSRGWPLSRIMDRLFEEADELV